MPSGDQSGEDRLIARFFAPLATHPGALGLTDDAAALTPPAGCDLVVTTDAIVGGVHFFPDDPPGTIAQKALRVNLSDLAAKGADPVGFVLALALPAGTDDAWLGAFADGLRADAEAYRCPLLGGDTTATPGPPVLAVTAFGVVPQGGMLRRSGARPGDRVMVTGTIGDAALGLALRGDPAASGRWRLDAPARAHLARRYLVPEPRTALAAALRQHASAAMDVSDGLAGDLAKLCRVSGVTAEIDVARVPLSAAAQAAVAAGPGTIETILTGGDDYEIVAAVPPTALAPLSAAASAAGVALTEIGAIAAGDAAPRFVHNGHALQFGRRSYSHF